MHVCVAPSILGVGWSRGNGRIANGRSRNTNGLMVTRKREAIVEIRQLRFAVRVAETRHFGQAADLEHIATSVLSTQIKRLETELGIELFHRTPRGVEITAAGERFLTEVKPILNSLTTLADETRATSRSQRQSIRIGYFGEALGELTHPLFAAFSERFPDTQLTFTELFMNNQIEALHAQQVDVAFLRLPVEDPELEVVPLYAEPVHAAVSSRGPFAAAQSLRVEDLLDEPFAVAAGGTPSSWSSYWSLDSLRGGQSRIGAEVTTVSESFSSIAYSSTIDTVPASAGRAIPHAGVAFVPIADAALTTLAFVSPRASKNPMIAPLRDIATQLVQDRLQLLAGAEALV